MIARFRVNHVVAYVCHLPVISYGSSNCTVVWCLAKASPKLKQLLGSFTSHKSLYILCPLRRCKIYIQCPLRPISRKM